MRNKIIALIVFAVLLVPVVAQAVPGYPTKGKVKNVVLTTAGQVYNVVIPAGTGAVSIQNRQANNVNIADSVDASIYYTIKSGTRVDVAPLSVDQTLYAFSLSGAQTLEVLYWQ